MPRLTVTIDSSTHELEFQAGRPVRETLERSGLRVRSGCRGDGACGLCLVQVGAGLVDPPTRNEHLTLTAAQLDQNLRLACQLSPVGDLCIKVVSPVPVSKWRRAMAESFVFAPLSAALDAPACAQPPGNKSSLGVAIDLGTTQISISLWNLVTRRRLDSRVGPNPQAVFGSDIVTRLIAAGESPENVSRLAWLPLEAVYEALGEMCSQAKLQTRDIVRVLLVGNTAMLALLTEQDPQLLLESRFWNRRLSCKPGNSERWISALGLHPQAAFEVIPPLAGYIGSDLLAGLIATDMAARPGGLLIDFGTNSEMALWDGRVLWAASASGGPAFEGCGIRCGMPGEQGAICRVEAFDSSASSTAGLQYTVIGGCAPRGICGSGLVDLVSHLRRNGCLEATGRFGKTVMNKEFVIRQEAPPLKLTKPDVDVLQRAKAAIGLGITTLLSRAQMRSSDLNHLYVSGAFGQQLNIRNAQSIGLLPNLDSARVQLSGNTALAGCERLLLDPAAARTLSRLRDASVVVNLADTPDFDALFLEHLYLQPLQAQGSDAFAGTKGSL